MGILEDRMAETVTLRLFTSEGAKVENLINSKASVDLQEMP